MDTNQIYTTLSGAVEGLQKEGFINTFKMKEGVMTCIESGNPVQPKDVRIVEFHRFEGETNPSDMSILYAVECKDCTKGIIVAAYGMYADMELVDFIQKVELNTEEVLTNND